MSGATVVLPPPEPTSEPREWPEASGPMRRIMLARKLQLNWRDGDLTGIHGGKDEAHLDTFEPGEIELPEALYAAYRDYIRCFEVGYKAPKPEDIRGTSSGRLSTAMDRRFTRATKSDPGLAWSLPG